MESFGYVGTLLVICPSSGHMCMYTFITHVLKRAQPHLFISFLPFLNFFQTPSHPFIPLTSPLSLVPPFLPLFQSPHLPYSLSLFSPPTSPPLPLSHLNPPFLPLPLLPFGRTTFSPKMGVSNMWACLMSYSLSYLTIV